MSYLIQISVLVALTISASAHPKPTCCTCQNDCMPGSVCSERTACNDNGQLKGTCIPSYGPQLGVQRDCTVEGAYQPDPKNPCSDIYYRCTNGKWVYQHCSTDKKFNIKTAECDSEENVVACATVPDTCNPAKEDYMANPTNPCSGLFYQCDNGKWAPQQCPGVLVFDVNTNRCENVRDVDACKTAVPDHCLEGFDDYLDDPVNPCSGTFYQCSNDRWVEQRCPDDLKFNVETNQCDSEENVAACPKVGHDCTVEGAYLPDPKNPCSDIYYRCTDGKFVEDNCPVDQKFNIKTAECDSEENVFFCATVPDTCDEDKDDYMSEPTKPCSYIFYQCSNGQWVKKECGGNLKFNVETNTCDYERNIAACKIAVPDYCFDGFDDYLGDPVNPCSGTFYQCYNATWMEQRCPDDLKFNVETNQCDSEENVSACATATASPIKTIRWTKPAKPTDYEFALFNNVKCEFERELGKSFPQAVPVLYRRQVQTIYYQMLVSLDTTYYGIAEVYVPPPTAKDPFPSLQSAKIVEYPDPLTMFG